jgi:activator of HSP90 ATPase
LKLTFKWKGEDEKGIELTGKGIIPEVAHDTEKDDFVFDITADDDSRALNHIKEVVRKHIKEPMVPIFLSLTKVFMEQGKDVYIEGATPSAFLPTADLEERKRLAETVVKDFVPPFSVEERSGKGNGSSTTPVSSSKKPAAPASNSAPRPTPTASKKSPGSLTMKYDFHASLNDVYDCFMVPEKLKQWTQGQGEVVPSLGGQFNLYGGQVKAFLKEVSSTKLVLAWKFKDWEAESEASLNFEESADGSRITLNQTGFSVENRPQLEAHWNHVFKSIKLCFGYGGLF